MSVFTGKVHIDEFVAALRRFEGLGECVLERFEAILPLVGSKDQIVPTKFLAVLEQVELDVRVEQEFQRAQKEKAADDAILPADLSKEQRADIQLRSLRQRIAEQILEKYATSRKGAVDLLAKVNDALSKLEEVEPGAVKDADFKICIKELEFGISSTHQVDLWKACAAKGTGMVSIPSLSSFLVSAMGKMRLESPALPVTPQFRGMQDLCQVCGVHEARMTFEDIYDEAVNYRNDVNTGAAGWINTKVLLAELARSHEGDSFSLGKRKDIVSVVGQYCKSIDRHSDGVVETSRIVVFLRFVEVELGKRQAMLDMPVEEKRRKDIRHRMFRALLQVRNCKPERGQRA